MPSYNHLDSNRLTFYGVDGLLYELRSLPLLKRDLFISRWIGFKAMALEVDDLGAFAQRYDRLLVDGRPNPEHDSDFRREVEWLLGYIVAYDTISQDARKLIDIVDASTVVGLLLSKDGGPSIIEQLEFPAPVEGKEKGKPLPDGVDPTAHATANLMSFTDGDPAKAIALATEQPYQELSEVLGEYNRVMSEAQGKPQKDQTSSNASNSDPLSEMLDLQLTGAKPNTTPNPVSDDRARQAKAEFAGDMAKVLHGMNRAASKEVKP